MKKAMKTIAVLLYNGLTALRVVKYYIKRHFHMNISMSELAAIGDQLRYGHVAGHMLLIEDQWGASEVVKAASGRFVRKDANGRVEICPDGETEIYGFAEHRQETTSSTEGGTKTQVNIALDAVYKIPVNAGTYLRTMAGKTCDLAVSSSIQGAKLDASGEDVIQLLAGDLTNNHWVLCRINPLKVAADGVV